MIQKILRKIFYAKTKAEPLVNILTRTSNRPRGFEKNYESVVGQTYKNVRHIVSYDTPEDLQYLNKYNVDLIRVFRKKDPPEELLKLSNKEFKPYNLYCNDLLEEIKEGWVIFLDDDDYLKDENVLENIIKKIRRVGEDTLIIGYTRYPNGTLLPSKETFRKKEIKLRQIDTACFVFHSKYKNAAKWDCWWAADFRFVKEISMKIPKQSWIPFVLTQKSTAGGLGKRRDVTE